MEDLDRCEKIYQSLVPTRKYRKELGRTQTFEQDPIRERDQRPNIRRPIRMVQAPLKREQSPHNLRYLPMLRTGLQEDEGPEGEHEYGDDGVREGDEVLYSDGPDLECSAGWLGGWGCAGLEGR